MRRVAFDADYFGDVCRRVQTPLAAGLPWMSRLAEDDLCGTCRKLIGAMFEAVMRRAVVFVVWDSSIVTVAGSWEMSEVQWRETVAAVMTAEGILRME